MEIEMSDLHQAINTLCKRIAAQHEEASTMDARVEVQGQLWKATNQAHLQNKAHFWLCYELEKNSTAEFREFAKAYRLDLTDLLVDFHLYMMGTKPLGGGANDRGKD
jgi:hypothetical protein